jgi:nucleotide-binding universal stress UspA family protein
MLIQCARAQKKKNSRARPGVAPVGARIEVAGTPARIALLHAWRPDGVDVLGEANDALAPDALQEYIDGQAYAHAVWLEERQRDLGESIAGHRRAGVIACTAEWLEGSPGDVVPAWLDANDVDLLVLGTTGTGAAPGQLIGDTAETILLRSRMPVLSVKPADFRSPVIASSAPPRTVASAEDTIAEPVS